MRFTLSEAVKVKQLSIGNEIEFENRIFSCLNLIMSGGFSIIVFKNLAPKLRVGYLVSALYLRPNPYLVIDVLLNDFYPWLHIPPSEKVEFS